MQVYHLGLEGKIVGSANGKLILKNGTVYDLRDVIGFGYDQTEKYDFEIEEIPFNAIRTFRKKE